MSRLPVASSGIGQADLARSGFRKSAFRCKVPEELLPQLAPLVLDVLGLMPGQMPEDPEAEDTLYNTSMYRTRRWRKFQR